jgi:uncharacterized repeat protein (TIGR03837 family)
MRWDIFCHVIDNLGDAGVCWRLCALLARETQDHVTLWIDKPEVLLPLAPLKSRPTNIDVKLWQATPTDAISLDNHLPPDVVIEAFGCRTPERYQSFASELCAQSIWINLEYLSAQPYVVRSHGLPSPVMSGPRKGAVQWFYYPGFTQGTGGIMQADAPDLSRKPLEPYPQNAYLFSYETPALKPLCEALIERNITPHIAAGRGASYVQAQFDAQLQATCRFTPLVPQLEFDDLLVGNALNVVRGEDSFVRAQLAARPFIWHIYPQEDNAHRAKLSAFFELYSVQLPENLKQLLWLVWEHFNDGTLTTAQTHALLEHLPAYTAHAAVWRQSLLQREDLVAQLRGFIKSKAEKS